MITRIRYEIKLETHSRYVPLSNTVARPHEERFIHGFPIGREFGVGVFEPALGKERKGFNEILWKAIRRLLRNTHARLGISCS